MMAMLSAASCLLAEVSSKTQPHQYEVQGMTREQKAELYIDLAKVPEVFAEIREALDKADVIYNSDIPDSEKKLGIFDVLIALDLCE